jgi:hypothetical protein
MLITYDLDYPSPLREQRPIADAFAVAMLLRPTAAAGAICQLECALGARLVTKLNRPELESLRLSAPAARCLPVLELMANGREGSVSVEYLDSLSLAVTVKPWV